jgi:molybdopterin converting factor small subunit
VTQTASGGSTPAANGTSRYLDFDRDTWSELRAATPLTLAQPELERLRGINERIDLDEVATVYLPLSRLLNLYVSATQDLHRVSATFLGTIAPKVPYVIGIAGSVAGGKSTFALDGASVRDVVEAIDRDYPGFQDRVLAPDGSVRGEVCVVVNGQGVPSGDGADAPLIWGDQVYLLYAIAGG